MNVVLYLSSIKGNALITVNIVLFHGGDVCKIKKMVRAPCILLQSLVSG